MSNKLSLNKKKKTKSLFYLKIDLDLEDLEHVHLKFIIILKKHTK